MQYFWVFYLLFLSDLLARACGNSAWLKSPVPLPRRSCACCDAHRNTGTPTTCSSSSQAWEEVRTPGTAPFLLLHTPGPREVHVFNAGALQALHGKKVCLCGNSCVHVGTGVFTRCHFPGLPRAVTTLISVQTQSKGVLLAPEQTALHFSFSSPLPARLRPGSSWNGPAGARWVPNCAPIPWQAQAVIQPHAAAVPAHLKITHRAASGWSKWLW